MPSQIPDKGTVKTPGGYDAVVQAVMQVDEQGNYAGGGGGGSTGGLTDTQLRAAPVEIEGGVAAGEPDAGMPVKVGGVANNGVPTARSTGQRTDQWSSAHGGMIVAAPAFTGGDGLSDASLRRGLPSASSASAGMMVTANYNFNGVSWDRTRGDIYGSWVGGNVASGAADAGNPVKVGGVYNNPNPTLAAGQRADLQLTARGLVSTAITDVTGALQATVTNAGDAMNSATQRLVTSALSYTYDSAAGNWNRTRGTTNGLWIEGAVASGVADAGNPVKVAGVFNTTLPTLATGQRGDIQLTARGEQISALSAAGVAISGRGSNTDAATASSTASNLAVYAYQGYFNGTTWDRQRGDTSGAYNAAVSFFTESSTPLASAGSISGSLRSSGGVSGGVGSRFNFFVAEAFADQSGTLYIDKSVDGGTTWRQVGSIAAVAGTSVSLKVPVTAVSYRSRFVNGATAQTAFLLTSSFASA